MRSLLFAFFFTSLLGAAAPQFRIDSGAHDERIRALLFFDNDTKLITVADKKIRLWDIESQTLLNTYRPISHEGHIGKIYTAVLSPDEKRLYIAGFMGDEKGSAVSVGDIAVIDTASFEIVRRFKADYFDGQAGHRGSVGHLKVSKEGKWLVSTGDTTLLIWDVASGTVLKRFKLDKYLEEITALDLGEKKIVVAGKRAYDNGVKSALVEIDPDTDRVRYAVHSGAISDAAYADDQLLYARKDLLFYRSEIRATPEIENGRKGKTLFEVKNKPVHAFCVSPDAKQMFVGSGDIGASSYLYALDGKRTLPLDLESEIACCSYGGSDLLALGDLVGNVYVYRGGERIFTSPKAAETVTAVGIEGDTVFLGHHLGQLLTAPSIFDEHPLDFAIKMASGVSVVPVDGKVPERALSEFGDLRISTPDGFMHTDLELNKGSASWFTLKRDIYKGHYHTAATLVPEHPFLISGSAVGKIGAYELGYGNLVHTFYGHAGKITALAVSRDGQYLVSGSDDKTAKIWSLKNIMHDLKHQKPDRAFIEESVRTYGANKEYSAALEEMGYSIDFEGIVRFKQDYGLPLSKHPPVSEPLATIFVSGDEWIVWNEAGYYASSPLGDEKIGWVINGKKDAWATWVGANQFERALYNPKLVSEWIRRHGDEHVYAKYGVEKEALATLLAHPPVKAEILSPQSASYGEDGYGNLEFKLDDAVQGYTVYVNDIPVVHQANASARHYNHRVPLFGRFNRVQVETMDGGKMARSEVLIKSRSAQAPKGDLYLLSVGVKGFEHLKGKDLRLTARDAEKIAEVLQAQEGKRFHNVFTKVLTDDTLLKPTKRNILDALSFLDFVKATDTVVIFLASHGVSDSDGEYYFVPSDALQKDIDTLDDPHRKITSLVSWNRFFDTLRGTLGKRILIVDTCESKNIAGTYELYSLIKRSASSNFAIITASKGDEYSQEYAKGGHGLFTYGFLKALEGEGDRNSDGAVSLNEAFDYASETVARLHNRDVGPQTPQISGAASLLNGPFIRVESR